MVILPRIQAIQMSEFAMYQSRSIKVLLLALLFSLSSQCMATPISINFDIDGLFKNADFNLRVANFVGNDLIVDHSSAAPDAGKKVQPGFRLLDGTLNVARPNGDALQGRIRVGLRVGLRAGARLGLRAGLRRGNVRLMRFDVRRDLWLRARTLNPQARLGKRFLRAPADIRNFQLGASGFDKSQQLVWGVVDQGGLFALGLAVPAPMTLALASLGLLAVFGLRRRWR